MSDALSALEGLYVFMTSNLAALQAAFPADPEKSRLMSLYVAARTSYWKCVDATFHDDDPAITALVTQMNAQQATIAAEVAAMNDVGKILNAITSAVQIGARLASLGA